MDIETMRLCILGGPAMITSDMMEYIRSDLVVFGIAVASVFAVMLFLFFGNIWFVILPISNAFLTTFRHCRLSWLYGLENKRCFFKFYCLIINFDNFFDSPCLSKN